MNWFRVEPADRGEAVDLDPYVPRRASVREDRTIPRIPVCPSIEQCLIAITVLHLSPEAWVYRALGRPRPALDLDSPSRFVPDWEETEEAWIVEPHRFKRLYRIEIDAGILNEPEIRWRRRPRGSWRVARD